MTESRKWGVGPRDTHLCLLNGANLIEVRPLPSHRDWETGAQSSGVVWNRQEILLAALSFLRQAL